MPEAIMWKRLCSEKNLSEAGMYRSDSEKPASSAERENSNQPS